MFAEVIVDINNNNVDKIYDYSISNIPVSLGCRVFVPFGNRIIEGYVINLKESSSYDKNKIKPITSLVDDFPVITGEMIELMHFMVKKYHLRYIDALRLFLPTEMRSGKVKALSKYFCMVINDFDIDSFKVKIRKNAINQLALLDFIEKGKEYSKAELCEKFSGAAVNKFIEEGVLLLSEKQILRAPQFFDYSIKKLKHSTLQQNCIDELAKGKSETYLLFGVTGSGKTEVYMSAIEKVIAEGKTAIMLVPEISLTPQVLSIFKARFGDFVAILHSGLSAGERFDEWKRLRLKNAKIAIGARSAIFAPLTDLGLIIIDEEHEQSYISENNPRYDTKVIAQFRKDYNNCPLILGSATPSIDSFNKAENGEYKLLELPVRINGKDMPKIQIVDMLSELKLGNNEIFSKALIDELHRCIKNDKQAMLFINRRGFSSFMRCNKCGYIAKCDSCDVSLVYHKEDEKLKCHFCGKRYKALTKCPECGNVGIRQGAVGTERVASELNKFFPGVKVLRMDNDTTQTKNAHQIILGEFAKTKPAILVGTQMIAKGHDFKDVTLVGIIDADQSLYQSDYRSTERTFELITQMSGRAGRDESLGKVILQTYAPKHYAYKFIANYNYKGFYEKEINLRKVTSFPPFSNILRLLFTSDNEELTREVTKMCYNKIYDLSLAYKEDFVYYDVMKSPVGRIKNKFRYQILIRLKTERAEEIIDKIYNALNECENSKVMAFVEINPQSLS